MTPLNAQLLNLDQKQIFYKWILHGGLNNYCDQEPCDSINVTFTVTVFPIIQNNCYGCHSVGNPGGGVSLTNYNQVKAGASIPPGHQKVSWGNNPWKWKCANAKERKSAFRR
jgi:hypothetical protein